MQLCKSLGREHLRTRRFTNRQRQARQRRPSRGHARRLWSALYRAAGQSRCKLAVIGNVTDGHVAQCMPTLRSLCCLHLHVGVYQQPLRSDGG